MKTMVFLLIAGVLLGGCTAPEQASPEPGPQVDEPVVVPVRPLPSVTNATVSADAWVDGINYIYTSSVYGGFIESIEFTVRNTGEKPITVLVDYSITDLSMSGDSEPGIVLEGLGAEIIPVGTLFPGEEETYTWFVPKERIRTGHLYEVELTIKDRLTNTELAIIRKEERLPNTSAG